MDSGIGIGGLAISQDEVASSAFDLFAPIEIENSITKASKVVTRPISASNSRGPFKFLFPADPEKWTDCESLRLSGRVKIRRYEAGALKDFDNSVKEVSTVNNFYQSLFSSVICTVNGVDITDPSGNWYPYKAYLETLLSYSQTTKDGRLQSLCYYTDDAGKFDNIGAVGANSETTTPSTNDGYKRRLNFFSNSKWRHFNIPIHSDICTLRKYLPPNTKLEFEFQRTPDKFSLLTPLAQDSVAIVIENLALSITRYTPSVSINNFYQNKLNKVKRQVLPIDRSLIKTYTVQSGQSDLSHYNIISGHQLPDQIIIGMVNQTAHSGSLTENPFNFQHFNISEASIVVNGIHEPTEPYKMNIPAGDYINLYTDFLLNTGIGNEDRDFGIDQADYTGGCFFLAFDRSKEKCNRFHRHPHDSGTIDVNIRSRANLTSTVTVVIYATYSSEIIMDDRNTVELIKNF